MRPARGIDPYFVSNLAASYGIDLRKAGELRLKFTLNNLFNAEYENNAYGGMWTEDGNEKTWAYYFPQAGINWMAGISLTF